MLTNEQAKENLKKYGPNELEEGKKKSVFQIFLEQFKDFLVIILIISAVISGFLGDVESAIVIFVVITMNAILGTVQHFKAQKSLESLKAMSAPHARVLRDGESLKFPRFPSCRGISCCWRQGYCRRRWSHFGELFFAGKRIRFDG